MLVKANKQQVASLPSLIRLAVRYVYDKKRMRSDEIALMEESVIAWNKNAFISEEEKFMLHRIAWFLKKNEDGEFEERKELFKRKGINWAKFHTISDMAHYAE